MEYQGAMIRIWLFNLCNIFRAHLKCTSNTTHEAADAHLNLDNPNQMTIWMHSCGYEFNLLQHVVGMSGMYIANYMMVTIRERDYIGNIYIPHITCTFTPNADGKYTWKLMQLKRANENTLISCWAVLTFKESRRQTSFQEHLLEYLLLHHYACGCS